MNTIAQAMTHSTPAARREMLTAQEVPDMSAQALNWTAVTLLLSFLYLAATGAWLWFGTHAYQNCLK